MILRRLRLRAVLSRKRQDINIMKKPRRTKCAAKQDDDLLPEYRFDFKKACPNRFASQLKRGIRIVVLDPDVANVFSTSDSVNAVLRALIENMPRNSST